MVQYDYVRQAWVRDRRYEECGHLFPCDCYGKAHAGEQVDDETRERMDRQRNETPAR